MLNTVATRTLATNLANFEIFIQLQVIEYDRYEQTNHDRRDEQVV